jgi:endo-1,4-beta-D-glucanase Y
MNTDSGSGSGSNQINIILPEKAIGILPIYGYANGNDFADATALAHDMNKEYVEWRNAYVSNDGIKLPASKLRVKRNDADKADTVSEGIGYGMLLSVYFNDQQTFNGLYSYSQSHRTDKTSPNARLMHWKIRKDDKEVSEFDEYEVDTTTYTITYKEGTTTKTLTLKSADTTIPQGRVMKNTRNGKIVVLPFTLTANETSEAITYLTGLNKDTNGLGDFIAANVYPRDKGSSALDADEDMATSLIMAYYRWHNQYYLDEAKLFIKDILKNCITATDFIKAGNLWGDEKCWNPSYFAPAWYRLYAQVCPEDKARWDNVIKNGYAHFAKLNAANGSAGFFPDWCNTSGATAVKADGSDRHYIDDNGFTNVTLQSYNYYYDGVRTPWRIAMDYSWFGSASETNAFNLLSETVNTVQNTIGIDKIVDGYAIDGGAWNRINRDGFNNLWDATKAAYKNGGTSHSSTFVSMNATVSMLSSDATFKKACFDETVKVRDALPLTYFGDCLRMMSLLYQSGRFVNFADGPSLIIENSTTVKDTVTLGPLTIDAGNVNFALYGITNCKVNDYAHIYTADGKGFSTIGSGAKILTPGDGNVGEMNLGYCSVMGDVKCGTKTMTLRDALIFGNLFARNELANFSRDSHTLTFSPDPNLTHIRYITGFVKTNILSDEGINAMEFSAPISGFQTGTSTIPQNANNQIFTLTPGYYAQFNTNGSNTITFNSGIYCFDTFTIGTSDKLVFPADGSVVIFVKNDFSIKSRTKMLNITAGVESGADPSKILFVVGSSFAKIEPQVNWRGTLIVPNGFLEGNLGYEEDNKQINAYNPDLINKLASSSGTSYKEMSPIGENFGAFYANSVEVHQGSCNFLVPFDYNSIKGWTMPATGSGGVVAPKSSDATLYSLTVGGTSIPLGTTPYTLSVPNTTTSVTVTATTTSSKASYTVTANPATLVVGANTVTVRVTAENGTTKDYSVTVTRLTAGTTVPPTVITVTKSGTIYKDLVGENTFSITIPSGSNGTIQVKGDNGVDMTGVQVSVNGGTYKNLPNSWGGPISVTGGTTVTLKVKIPGTSSKSIVIEYWA